LTPIYLLLFIDASMSSRNLSILSPATDEMSRSVISLSLRS